MNYKPLGNTGISLPEIGFGTWRYNAGVGPLREAINLGAVLIDTAEAYGTEQIVGEAIRDRRSEVFLATKVSPRNFRRADLLRAADESLKRLRTSYIDLYQLHWPNYTVPLEETLAGLAELVKMGKVRFIGVSNFSPAELRRAQAVLSPHRIVSNQVRYSLVDRTIESGLLQYCQANQITVIAHSPLGEGLPYVRAKDPAATLNLVSAEIGRTEAQVALNWCIFKPGIIAIPKASSSAHIREDWGAGGWRLSPEHVRLLDRRIKFRKRGRVDASLRRLARRFLQYSGRQLGSSG